MIKDRWIRPTITITFPEYHELVDEGEAGTHVELVMETDRGTVARPMNRVEYDEASRMICELAARRVLDHHALRLCVRRAVP